MLNPENPAWEEFLQSPQFHQAMQRVKDEGHLAFLSTSFYIMGAVTLVFSLFFIFYIGMGAMFFHDPSMWNTPSTKPGAPPIEAPFNPGYVFVFIGSFMMLICWIYGGFCIAAGKWTALRKSHLGIQIVAAIGSLNVPIGTILGVFALTTLARPSVRELFGIETKSPFPPSGPTYVTPIHPLP